MITLTPPRKPWQHRRPGRRGFPRRIAQAIIARDPQCTLALPGCTHTSTQADHIVSWAAAMALGWTTEQIDDPSNGRGVCAACHTKITQQQAATGRRRAQARRSRSRPQQRHPGLR